MDGEFFLDVKNPKLYKKVRKYYENNGVTFSGDPLDDQDILIDCLAEDLNSSVELTSHSCLIMNVLLESQGYRFIENGTIELNGLPDYRLQEKNEFTKRWNDSYLFDNQDQCLLAMEDIQYCHWPLVNLPTLQLVSDRH